MKRAMSVFLLFIALSLIIVAILIGIVAIEYKVFMWGCLAGGLSLGALLLLWWRKTVVVILRSNIFKQASQSLVTVFLCVCIMGILNFLIVKNDLTLDFTKNKIHSLSSQSRDALELIQPKEVLTMKLFAQRSDWERFGSLLRLYKNYKRDQIELQFIDVEREPALSELYNVKESGTLVLEFKGQKFNTVAKDELTVTNLLLKILSPHKITLYYTVGHNEVSFTDKNLLGADYLRDKILSSNFQLKALELHKGIPKDCSGILIMNPQIDFLKSEISKLQAYLKNGGGLLFALSPQFNGLLTKNLLGFAQRLGLTFNNALILDRLASRQGSQPSIPVIQSYNLEHPITKKMETRTFFPVSGFFSFNESNLFSWDILIKSAPFPATWGEVSFEEVKAGKAIYNESSDYKGPLNLMVAGNNDKSRVVGISSSQFVANQFQGQTPNFNLFLNALSWVVREESLISLDRPQLSGELVYISDIHASLIFYVAVVFFPFVFFVIGIIFYRKRLRL